MGGRLRVSVLCAAVLAVILVEVSLSVPQQAPVRGQYSVLDYGAVCDGIAKDTEAVQRAIDTCARQGGGTVYFPPGTYLCGSLHLRSHVALYLDHGAVLKASRDEDDFDPYEELDFENDADHETSYFHYALLWGEDVEHVAIVGTGTIDGNREKRGGPKPIALKRCKHVTIRDVTIANAPNYAISMLGTDYVNIDGVNILNGYCDGIDPDCCHNVRISNCYIDSWDDAVVPKASFSLGYHRSTENIAVTNCILATSCNAFKLGTESGGDFKRIAISNCTMITRPGKRPPISGIAIESVDGSNIDGIVADNISMNGVRAPIFIRLGNRGRDMDTPVPGTLKNVIIRGITASGAQLACAISVIPGHPIEGVTLEAIGITFRGGGTLEESLVTVPEQENRYPEATMFGGLPAYGFYCRHVKGLRLAGIRLALEEDDQRHALFCDDVSELEVESLSVPWVAGSNSLLRLHQTRRALIRGCQVPLGTEVFLKVSGEDSWDIVLTDNDFSKVKTVFAVDAGAEPGSVSQLCNHGPR